MANYPLMSLEILLSYTIPLCYLLGLYMLYIILHVLLILDSGIYFLFLFLHYIPAVIYVIHKIAVHSSIKNVLVTTLSFVLFPVHFLLTLYYKIMFSLMIVKINNPGGEETSSLLNKIEADQPLNTFIILFSCVQVPLELILQICIYLSQRRHNTSTTVLVTLNLILCLLLFTNGVVRYFRFETQNIHKYLHNHMRERSNVKATKTYKKNVKESNKRMSQFEEDKETNQTVVVDSHTLIFKAVVFVKWLLHNYIRAVSIGLVLFFYPNFTILFFTVQTILSFIVLLFYSLKYERKANVLYNVLQSILLNLCLIEYKIKLCDRKLVFVTYFLIIFAENLLFNYLWFFTINWSRRYRDLFQGTLLSLIVCQILHFVLLFVYFVFYKPKSYEIDYNADADDEDEGNDTNESDNEEEFRDIDNHNGFKTNVSQRYENVNDKSTERTNNTSRHVDRIRTTNNAVTSDTKQINGTRKQQKQSRGHKVAFDNMIYTETEKQRPSSKYKELINDTDERTIYPQEQETSDKAKTRQSLTTQGVNPDQRESWKYVVEEIDDQIHKSTSNLSKTKLHLSSDRLNAKKFNRSTDSLETDLRFKSSLATTRNPPHSVLETTHTKSYKHMTHGTSPSTTEATCSKTIDGTNVDMDDVQDEEEIVMENKYVDSSNTDNRRTSRYSSQEFIETRRTDERVYEERKMNVKKINTTSLV